MPARKVTIYLKQKRFLFGQLKAKYWADNDADYFGLREGFRNIHIYEAELRCRKSVITNDMGSANLTTGLTFSNQDKIRKKYHAIFNQAKENSGKQNIGANSDAAISDILEIKGSTSDLRKASNDFRRAYRNYRVRTITTNFISQFPSPLKTVVVDGRNSELFELNFESAKLYHFKLSKIQDEGAESSGTIEGIFIGYIIELVPRDIEIDEAEPAGVKIDSPVSGTREEFPRFTGKSEQKNIGIYFYRRYEVEEVPGSFGWTDWNKAGNAYKPQKIYTFWEAVSYIFLFGIGLMLLVVSWKILLGFLIIGGITWLFSTQIWNHVTGFFTNFLRFVFSFIVILFLIGGVSSFILNYNQFGRQKAHQDKKTERQKEDVNKNDTIISNFRSWNDYHGNHYEGYLQVRKSDYRNSKYFRTNYSDVGIESGYGRMCSSLIKTDSTKLDLLYVFFDSLKVQNRLDNDLFAEVIITCIQDIPYSLITPGPCDYRAYPPADFAHNYLRGGGLCEGYEKNGILAPAEFCATLKGDCDTRTVFAYTVLKHFGYKVVVMTSTFYGHSILGLHLTDSPDYSITTIRQKEISYAMCELTTFGPKPGQLSARVSDMSKWKVELN